jgi:hypothetical protein
VRGDLGLALPPEEIRQVSSAVAHSPFHEGVAASRDAMDPPGAAAPGGKQKRGGFGTDVCSSSGARARSTARRTTGPTRSLATTLQAPMPAIGEERVCRGRMREPCFAMTAVPGGAVDALELGPAQELVPGIPLPLRLAERRGRGRDTHW